MKVKEVMDANYPTIGPYELASRARAILRDFGLRFLPVVDTSEKVVGSITRREVLLLTSTKSKVLVKTIMNDNPTLVWEDEDVRSAVRRMLSVDEWYSPVVRTSTDYTYSGAFGLEHVMAAYADRHVKFKEKKIGEIMTKSVVTVSPKERIPVVWHLMVEKGITGLPVVEEGKVLGIITQKDLLDKGVTRIELESDKGRFKHPPTISRVFKRSYLFLSPDSTVGEALDFMLKHDIGRVVVVDERKRLLGIVDREDVVRGLLGIR